MAKLYFEVQSDWQEVVRLREEITRLEGLLRRGGDPIQMRNLSMSLQTARERMLNLADGAARAGLSMSRANNSVTALIGGVRSLQGYGMQLGTSLLGGFGVATLTRQVFNIRSQFQSLEASFKTLLGSAEKASNLMNQLTKTAATTPFQLTDVTSAAQQLMAYGVQAEKVNETIIRLGDVASGLSIPIGQLAWLYGTTMTQGRLYMQDFNQFVSRGIPLADELARQFGVSKKEVRQLVTEGKVGFPQVEAAIKSMTDEGGKFGGMMMNKSKTLEGQWSNIKDSVDQMFNEIGRNTEGIFSESLSVISSLVENWKQVIGVVGTAAAAIGGYKAVLMLLSAARLASTKVLLLKTRLLRQAVLEKRMAAAEGIALGNAEAFAAARTKLFTLSLNGLKAAIATNPIGLLVTAITTVVGLFLTFGNSVDEAAERSEKYGESISKATGEVEGLYAVMQTAERTSKSYKTALDELKNKADEYGITINNEASLHDQLIEKKQVLLSLLREEAIERERANGIATAYDEYSKSKSKIKDDVIDDHRGDMSKIQMNQMFNLVSDDEIKKLNELYNKSREDRKKFFGKQDEVWKKSRKEFDDYYDSLIKKSTEYTKALGLSKQEQHWAFMSMRDYIAETRLAYNALDMKTKQEEQAAESARKVSRATDGMTDAQRRFANQMRLSEKSVDDLGMHIQSCLDAYNDSHIDIKIQYHEINPPKWMENFSSKKSNYMAAYYQSIADDLAAKNAANPNVNHTIKIGNETYDQRSAQVKSAQYSAQAKNAKKKEEEEEEKEKQEKEQKEKEKEKRDREARELAEKRKRDEEAKAKALADIKRTAKDMSEANKDASLEAEQAEIDIMQDGSEKMRRLADLQHRKELQDIEKRKEAEVKKLQDFAMAKWEAENPKATTQEREVKRAAIEKEVTEKDLPTEQVNLLTALTNKANTEYRRSLDEIAEAESVSMENYLSEYGTMQEKKTSIASRYNRMISKATTEGEKLRLQEEFKQALSNVDVDALKGEIHLDEIFSEIDIINPEAAERAKQQLQEFIDTTKSLTPEDIKLLTDAMEKLQERIDFSNPIASIRKAREEIRNAKAEYDKYQKQYNKAKSAGDKDGMKKASAGMNNAQRRQNRARKQEEKSYKALIEVVNEYAEALSELGDKIGGTAGKMLSLAGNSVICITSMLQGIQAFQTGMSNLERAIAILAIIQAAIKAATILFDVFSSLFATENLEWERMSEQYKQLSSVYDDLIDKKKEFVSISYGKDVNEATAEIKRLYEAEIKGLDAVARARLTYRKRGEHSVGYNMWKGKGKHEGYAWKDIAGGVSEILGREFKGLGDLIGMTQEQWEELVKRYPEYVANLDADFLNYLNEIRGKEEAIKAAAEAQTEQWTGFTSESFVDYFIDGLMDMDKSAQEFAKDFESYLVNAIVKALVMENNKEALNDLLEMINKATEDGKVTEQEVNEITDKGGKLMEKMKLRQELALKGFGVYDELKQQEASAGGFETMSQETGEELNGRFTALNITADGIAVAVDLLNVTASAISSQISDGAQRIFSCLNECLTIQSSALLELSEINSRQEIWHKPMMQMFSDITDIKKGIKDL